MTEAGGQVHWARNAAEAREQVKAICQRVGAKSVTKGKSMISEEIALNGALEEAGYEVVETDLGEYIIQLRKEHPSHIIAPAIHVLKEQVADDFRAHHIQFDKARPLEEPRQLISEAREVLRQKYLDSDVGITGANFLIAETGTSVIVTNEGNGRMCTSMPKIHVAITGMEKVVPSIEDLGLFLRLLIRSATGQRISSYVTTVTGPRGEDEVDGPEEFHLVIVDNGRSKMLADPNLREALYCLKCGACLNACPCSSVD